MVDVPFADEDGFAVLAESILSTLANVATPLTVLTGVAFGLIEMRRTRRDCKEPAGRIIYVLSKKLLGASLNVTA